MEGRELIKAYTTAHQLKRIKTQESLRAFQRTRLVQGDKGCQSFVSQSDFVRELPSQVTDIPAYSSRAELSRNVHLKLTSQEFHILALTHSLPPETAIQKSLKSKCFNL